MIFMLLIWLGLLIYGLLPAKLNILDIAADPGTVCMVWL